jgi:hypothetical protein
MNSIDNAEYHAEQLAIYNLACALHAYRVICFREQEVGSTQQTYFESLVDSSLYGAKLFEYDFSSPAQLRDNLNNMWQHQNRNVMMSFSVPSAVAAFKLLNLIPSDPSPKIPSYIYVF